MKAAQYSEFGDPGVIKIVEVDKPTPKDGQVLVEVKAAAINPFDYHVRSGAYGDMGLKLPVTIAADFSGVVVQAASDLKEGDEVFGSAQVLGGASGAAAEFAATNVANIAPKPNNVSFQEAAAIVLTGVSTLQALDQLNLGEGKKVLIHGGAGGIGSAAIQYAKHLGANIATTSQAKDKDFVTSLGAEEVVDYENEKFDEVLSGVDAVFDTIGGDTYRRSIHMLKDGGIIISMVEQPDEGHAGEHGVKALYQGTKVNTESLIKLKQLVEEGVIKPQIDREFPLDQAAEAYQYAETGHPQGKVVINITQ
jgi:NADPH:quinone reductase-like Zn-dependent oxidoreductase